MTYRKPIIILFTGHVGSSWLLSLLGSHPEIRQLGFEPIDDLSEVNIDAADYLKDVCRGIPLGLFPAGVRSIFGKRTDLLADSAPEAWDANLSEKHRYIVLKTRVSIRSQRRVFAEVIPRVDPVLILLRRRNKIKNAISQYKRTQLGITHLRTYSSLEERRKPIAVDEQYVLDQAFEFLRRELRTMHYYHAVTRRFGVEGHEVCYEDLLSKHDSEGFFRMLFLSLGVEGCQLSSDYEKMTDERMEHAIENLEDLRTIVRGTIFEPSMTDDSIDVAKDAYSGVPRFALEDDPEIREINTLFETTLPYK